jgi:NTP pyrophosphatase (non-canonical NTP hydrolase)
LETAGAMPAVSASEPMTNQTVDLEELKQRLRRFTAERDWSKYHSPKNLSMALSGEVGELLEHFQWLTEEESGALAPAKRAEVELELADILLYLLCLADRLGVDLLDAAARKIELNAKKYPADQVRGSARKYTER